MYDEYAFAKAYPQSITIILTKKERLRALLLRFRNFYAKPFLRYLSNSLFLLFAFIKAIIILVIDEENY